MIAEFYKQGFGSLSGLIRKRSSHDSLPDNHNFIYFPCCNLVILNVLVHKTSQNSIYRPLWVSCALINHPARPKIIDDPLTLIFRMGQGVCLLLFRVGKRPIHPLWLFASNRQLDYSWSKSKNHWRAVDYHVQDQATSVSLLFLGIKVADSSEKDNSV